MIAGCNIWRNDLSITAQVTMPAGVSYNSAPALIKLKYATGETVFVRYLPIDSFGNAMSQNVLFAMQ